LRSQLYTLEGNENFLLSEGLCPKLWNIIILRDPIDRLLAHLSHLREMSPDATFDFAEIPRGNSSWDPATLKPTYIFDTVPILSDNFVIRTLLGREVYLLPFGRINATHLELAKRVLEQFDTLYLMDESLDEEIKMTLGLDMWVDNGTRPGR